MSDKTVNTVFTAQDKMSATVKKVRGELGGFQKSVGGVKGAIPIFDKLSAATGGLVNPTTLAIGGAVALGGALIEATRAAAAEQINIARLGAALKANIPGWDGNTKAIESTISARERLAFSDDDLRQSLALLVPATHDVTEALRLQSIAMNLSRLRSTDLVETSVLISKVSQGNLTALKRFGITLKGVTTATEALAKIQEMSAGQVEAYADTLIGKTEALDIKLHDLQETVGTAFLPTVNEFADGLLILTDATTDATGGTNVLADAVQHGVDSFVHTIYPLTQTVDALRRWRDETVQGRKTAADLAASMDEDRIAASRLGERVNYTAGRFSKAYSAADDLAGALADVKKNANDAADALAEAIYGPDILASKLRELQYETRDTEARLKELSKKKHLTREDQREINELKGKLAELRSDTLTTATRLQTLGEPLPKGLLNSLNRQAGALDDAGTAAKRYYNWLYLIGQTFASGTTGPINQQNDSHRATGGPVLPGQRYTVGERGEETLVMSPSGGGYVIPNGGGSGNGGGGMVTVPIVLQLDGHTVWRSVDRYQLQRLKTTPVST